MSDLDYDRLSAQFDERYRINPLAGVEAALGRLVSDIRPLLSLEVGCGTGRWLPTLAGAEGRAIGVDLFFGMLTHVPHRPECTGLICAGADSLPFASPSFDLIASINALHHIEAPGVFVRRCAACLRQDGRLAFVHYDPGRPEQRWYVYENFAQTREGDLARFPRQEEIIDWMGEAGLVDLECEVAETIERHYVGRDVLADHFLGKESNSTLARLSCADYETGLAALEGHIERAETEGEALRFDVRLELLLLSGRKP